MRFRQLRCYIVALTALGFLSLGVPLQGQSPSHRLYLPILQASEKRDLGLALTNPTLSEVSVTLTARDYAGNLIVAPGITNPTTMILPASGQRALRSVEIFGEAFAGETGWLEVESPNSSVKGFFLVFDSALTYIDGSNLTSELSDRLIFPKIVATSKSSTEITVVNTASVELTTAISLYRNDGSLGTRKTILLGPYSGYSGNILELLPDAIGFEGYAVIESGSVSGESVESLIGFETYRNRSDVAALNAVPDSAHLRTGYLAHLASRNGYTTRLGLVNNTSQSQRVAIAAQGLEAGGQPLSPSSVTIERTIPPFGKLEETVEEAFALGGDALITGYIRYDVMGETRGLIGYLDYGTTDGALLSAVPAQGAGFSDLFFSHVAEDLVYYTGLAFLNPNAQRTSLTIDVFDREGNRIASTNPSLGPGERRAQLLEEWIPALPDQSGGYVHVTANKPVFSFQLFGSRSSLDFLANVTAQGTRLAPQGSGNTVKADSGANVMGDDGSSLVIPPGALSTDVPIELNGVDLSSLPGPSPTESIVTAVVAEPSGTRFHIPVKLTLPLAVQLLPDTALPLLIFDANANSYSLSEFSAIVDGSGRSASADVTHFTTFTAGQPKAQLLEVSAVVPPSGIAGSSVTVVGAGFAPSVEGNTVTFAGPDNASVVAEVAEASTTSLTAIVPIGVVTGNVIVQVGERSSLGKLFTVPQDNPVPVISLLMPASIPFGTTSVEVQIAGSGFNESSTVTYDGIPVASTLVDANLLLIEMVGNLLTAAFHEVVVSNPIPGGGTSDPEEFTVGFQVPAISSLTPSSAAVGASVEVTISGADFTTKSVVLVDGSPADATFQNSTALSFQLAAEEIGERFVSVSTPPPGGGVSNTAVFEVGDKPSGPVLSVQPVPSDAPVATEVQIEVDVRDSDGQPVSGVEVEFDVELGNGSVEPPKASSDSDGRIQVILTLGTLAGTNRIVARALDVASEPIEVTGTAGVASKIAIAEGDDQTGIKGTPLPIPLTVEATDKFENPVAGVRVVFAAGDGFGSVELPAARFTDENGLASTVATLGTLGVNQTFLATSSDLSGSPLTFRATAQDSGGGGGRGGDPDLPPTANAGTDQTITLPAVANLTGTASDDGVGGTTLTTTWSTLSGPGTVTFGDPNALSTTATFSLAGTYVLRLTASDGTLATTDDVTITAKVLTVSPSSVDVQISSGSTVIGSYQVTIHFNPTKVQVVSVGGGSGAGFTGIPTSANIDNNRGTVTLNHFQIGNSPSGSFTVARVTFTALQFGASNLTTSGVTVTDTLGNDVSAGFLSLSATTLTGN